jgi:hypothetical protein
LALGLAIVNELKLEARGALLERWMAHHLAETMLAAENASGAKKVKLERDAVNLILKLWLHRRALPERADPLSGVREAIEILKLLQPETDPWSRFRHERHTPGFNTMSQLFDAMSRALVGALTLTHIKSFPQLADVKFAHLDPMEQAVLEALNQWLPMIDTSPKPPKIVIVDADRPAENQASSGEEKEDISDEEKPARLARSMLIENLKRFYAQLGQLITQWEIAPP